MSVYRFCREWAAGIPDPDTFTAERRWRSVNVYYSGRTIYSYGSHFPMGYMLSPGIVWLNGDRVSNTTSRHQSELRAAVQRAGGRAIIVPESALGAAGVDYRTIEPVNIEFERFDVTEHVEDSPPDSMRTDIPPHPYITAGEDWRAPSVTFDSDGRPIWSGSGDAATDYVGWILSDGQRRAVMRTTGGRYRWHTVRHWLGDSVLRTPAGDYWLSSFDRQEPRPLYFLSRLSRPADTVDDAIESLAPESVRTARDMGRTVVRQGDMFAMETTLNTRQLRAMGGRFTKRRVTVEYNLDTRRRLAVRDALATILPGMPPRVAPIYPGTTVSRGACDALWEWHRERMAEWDAELLRRHAERFPEQVDYMARWYLHGNGGAISFRPHSWQRIRDVTGEPLLGTAHTASEVCTLPSGLQYARGMFYHEPGIIGERRDRDHIRRALPGRRWYLVARNTVPVTGPGRTVRRAP